jgi:hypothetical protein
MKKKLAVIFALITALMILFGFAGCSSDDDTGPSLPPAEEAGLENDGTTDYTPATGVQVYNPDSTAYTFVGADVPVRTPTDCAGETYRDAVAVVSKITSAGLLTLTLPAFATTVDWSEFEQFVESEPGVTAEPSDVQIAILDVFRVETTPNKSDLNLTNGTSSAVYIYADKDAVIQGQFSDPAGGGVVYTCLVNLILKKGWNSAILTESGTTSRIATKPIPADGSYKWVVSDDD